MHVVTAVHRFDDLSYAVCDPAGDMGECMQLGERQEGLCGRECMSTSVAACAAACGTLLDFNCVRTLSRLQLNA